MLVVYDDDKAADRALGRAAKPLKPSVRDSSSSASLLRSRPGFDRAVRA
jgi:hypothetical protein